MIPPSHLRVNMVKKGIHNTPTPNYESLCGNVNSNSQPPPPHDNPTQLRLKPPYPLNAQTDQGIGPSKEGFHTINSTKTISTTLP